MEDYYQILGIPENASEEEIKKRFRELAKKYHPDVGGDPEKFKKILEAYRVLSDKKLRQEYDMKRKMGRFEFPGFGFEDLESFFRKQDFDDLLSDLLEDFFSFYPEEKSKNIIVDLDVTIPEILNGTEKVLNFKRKVICPNCDGTGSETKRLTKCPICNGYGRIRSKSSFFTGFIFETSKICKNCNGTGKIPEKICDRCQGRGYIIKDEVVKINLPKNFNPYEIIKIAGLGDQDPKNKKSGDLLIRINIQKHPKYEIKGKDIITSIDLDIIDAILGKDLKIDFFGKNINVKIPENFTGNFIRLNGYGIHGGDLIIKLNIKPIKKLTPKIKELLRKIKEELEK
jgi:molecular chaperone DnaJ